MQRHGTKKFIAVHSKIKYISCTNSPTFLISAKSSSDQEFLDLKQFSAALKVQRNDFAIWFLSIFSVYSVTVKFTEQVDTSSTK